MCRSTCWLVIPIDLRAAKALPRNCGQAARGQKNSWRMGIFFFIIAYYVILCIDIMFSRRHWLQPLAHHVASAPTSTAPFACLPTFAASLGTSRLAFLCQAVDTFTWRQSPAQQRPKKTSLTTVDWSSGHWQGTQLTWHSWRRFSPIKAVPIRSLARQPTPLTKARSFDIYI
jgi:hypothetical protein